MREMLDPIFGETGGTIALFVISLVVVLLLILAVMWLIRRFGAGGAGAGARGRMPRLAIVDALPVDGRRRLVLVRRDNVEHLVLIGGTSDLVIEPSIIRTRTAQKPGQPPPGRSPGQPAGALTASTPSTAAAPATPRRGEPAASEEPIPFPPAPSRRPVPPPARTARPAAQPARAIAAPEPETTFRPRILAEMEARAAADEVDVTVSEAVTPSARFSDVTRATRANVFPDEAPSAAGDAGAEAYRRARPERGALALDDEAFAADLSPELDAPALLADDAPLGEDQVAGGPRVSDLEKEMARLLGEISSRRQS